MSQRNDREGPPRPSLSSRNAVTNEVRRAAWLAGAALCAIALTVVALAYSTSRTSRWVHHSREVSRLARSSLTYALDAESGLRGFLITHNRRSLEPQELAAAHLAATLDSLVGLTADNPGQRTAAQDLRSAIRTWSSGFARPVIETGALSGAAADRGLAGKALFDEVRARADQFIGVEDSLYSDRLDRSQRLHWFAAIAVCLEIALAILGLAWLVRQIITRARVEDEQQVELEDQATELEVQAAELEEQAAELEMANDELARAVSEAQEARSRAEAEARQKSRLAALLDAALSSAPTGFGFFDHDLRFLRGERHARPDPRQGRGRSHRPHALRARSGDCEGRRAVDATREGDAGARHERRVSLEAAGSRSWPARLVVELLPDHHAGR